MKNWKASAVLLTLLQFASPAAQGAPGDILFSDDFERAALGADWSVGGAGDAGIGTQTANSGTRSLYTRWDTVTVTSRVIDLSAIPAAELTVWIRHGDDAFSEDPDANEDLVVEYYNSAGSWVPLGTYLGGGTTGEVFTPTFTLWADALHAGFQIRFRQTGGSGSDWDYWHIDDVIVREVAPTPPVVGGFCDDFESGLGNWQVLASGGDAGIGNQTASSPSNSLYLRWGVVSVVSRTSDLSAVTGGSIQYWVQRGDDAFSENPENSEDLVVEYYNSSGVWQALETLPGNGTPGEQFSRNFPLPADAQHAQFQLRFRMTGGSGSDFDYWHVDDVCMGSATFPPPTPVAYYAMDELAWSGAAGEVLDGSGNGNHGVAVNGAQTVDPSPPTPPVTCRAGDIPANTSDAVFDAVDTGLDVDGAIGNSGTINFWFKSNTDWNDGQDRMLLDASNDLGNNNADKVFYLVKEGNGRLTFRLEDSNDQDTRARTGGNNFPANEWHHIAITWDLPNDRTELYLDGVLEDTSTTNVNGVIGNLDTLYIGDNRTTGVGGGEYTGNSANGTIDEVRIYNFVLTPAQIATDMNASHSCVAVDHIRILHDGEGLTCNPEQVTVQACVDATCSSFYTGSVTTTLTPPGWVGSDTITFTGSTTAQLRRTTVSTVTLGVTGTTPAPANAARCFNGATETCSMNFVDSGFIFDVPALTACKTSGNVTVSAVKKSDTGVACVPAFTGPRSVNFWSTYIDPNPVTGSPQVSVNGTPVATASPGTAFNLNFDANAQTTITVNYPDAGLMQLNARMDGMGSETGLVMTGSDQFVSVPVGLAVYAAISCPAGDASCPVFGQAGVPFNLNVKAACWVVDGDPDLSDNPATPNFRMANVPMTHSVVAPPAGAPGVLGVASFDFVAADNGVHAISNQTVSEVGVFRFTATPTAAAYFGQTVPAGTSPNIGRFTPDHYAVTANVITPACTSGALPSDHFTYARQPFNGTMTIQAQSAAPGNTRTSNYRSGFDTLDPTTELTFRNSATAAAYDDSLVTVVAGQDFSNGTTGEANLNLQFRWDMPEQDATDSTVQLTASTDEVTTISGSPISIGTTNVRFGRLALQNAFGSELLLLNVPLQAQTFSTASGYAINGDDGCTALTTAANLDLGNDIADPPLGTATISLGGGTTTGSIANNPLVAGDAGLSFSAPAPTASGYVDIRIDLSAYPWLQYDWDGNGTHDNDPIGRATFGIYKGNSRQIYLRERY